jgi:hypothetical protein
MEIVNEMPLVKTCAKCKIEKPAEANFVKNINSKDLYHSVCKQCIKEYQTANKDKMKEYQKGYQKVYKQENKEKLLEYTKQWQNNNRDKARASARKSIANQSPEKKAARKQYMKEYNKLWKQKNPEKFKAAQKRYNDNLKAKKQNDQ